MNFLEQVIIKKVEKLYSLDNSLYEKLKNITMNK